MTTSRWPRVLALSAVVGVITGVGVVALDRVIVGLLLRVFSEQPLAVRVVAPAVGLILAAACLHWVARDASPATTDEYIANFHDRGHLLPLGPVVGRVLASVATIGFGGAQGLEGPSIYGGAAIGSAVQRRLARYFQPDEVKMLLIAGAAVGLSAVFRAPATGAIFALEVPYRNDLATRAALPALVASISAYLTFVAFLGTDPLLVVQGDPSPDAIDLAGAVVVGVVAGVGARLFAALVRVAEWIAAHRGPGARPSWFRASRVIAAGAGLAGLALLAEAVLDAPLTLGPGYDALEWTTGVGRSFWPVVLLFVLRALATGVTIAGGGAGGTFIPPRRPGRAARPPGQLRLRRPSGHAVHRGRRVGVRRRRLPHTAGRGDVRGRVDRPAGLRRPRRLIATVLAQLTMGAGASCARHQRQRQRRPE